MKHDENYESSDVEDRRGESSGGRGFGGGGGLRLPTGRFGLGGLVVLIVLSVVFKTDLVSGVLGSGDGGALAPALPHDGVGRVVRRAALGAAAHARR